MLLPFSMVNKHSILFIINHLSMCILAVLNIFLVLYKHYHYHTQNVFIIFNTKSIPPLQHYHPVPSTRVPLSLSEPAYSRPCVNWSISTCLLGVWWHTPLTPACRRQRQEDLCKLETVNSVPHIVGQLWLHTKTLSLNVIIKLSFFVWLISLLIFTRLHPCCSIHEDSLPKAEWYSIM